MQTAELSLLSSHWRSSNSPNLSNGQRLAKLAVEGSFIKVLIDATVQELDLFKLNDGTPCINLPAKADDPDLQLVLLSVAVSLLQAFIQTNWTGPELSQEPASLFTDVKEETLNENAVLALSLSGEPIYHLTRHATFLLLARQLLGLDETPDPIQWSLPSIASWRIKASLVHLRILDEPVLLPECLLKDLEAYRDSLPRNEIDLIASQTLLLGHYHRIISVNTPSSERKSALLFLQAASEAGLEYELTGRLGKRTKFQQDEKAQLVVLARGRERPDFVSRKSTPASSDNPETLPLNDDTLLEKTAFTFLSSESSSRPALNTIDLNNQPPLHPLDQSLLLALSFNHANDSPSHGLTTNQIATFVTRVLDTSENWSVHSMGLLMRSRLESQRTRTVERGVLQIQSLVDQLRLSSTPEGLKETGAPVSERLRYFHDLALPSKWELEKELAKRFLGIGVVKSALEIFERLEMWEDVVQCYASGGRADKGIKVVKELLEGRMSESDNVMRARSGRQSARMSKTREAKLWCALGDLEKNPEWYEKAWEVSGQSSSRAMRSLGGHHFAAGRYEQASQCLRRATAIYPLHIRSWFILGCSELKRDAWAGAEEAFARCVALDDEDGESWNNLASVHLRMVDKEDDEVPQPEVLSDEEEDEPTLKKVSALPSDAPALPHSRKRAAFQCLRQAIRYSYESWRIWQNYMVIAIDVGEFSEACRALRKIVDLRSEKDQDACVDLPVLERLVDAVTQDAAAAVAEDHARGLAARVQELFDQTLLTRFSSNARIFLAHARLLRWAGDLKGSVEDHLKAYRCGVAQDSDLANNRKLFLEACQDVEDIVDVLENTGSREQDGELVLKDWQYQARSILRSFLGKTKATFEDEPAWERLKERQTELSAKK